MMGFFLEGPRSCCHFSFAFVRPRELEEGLAEDERQQRQSARRGERSNRTKKKER